MHNGYGSGDVDIRIALLAGGVIEEDDGEPVTVAGRPGRYRQIGGGRERWMVDVDGTVVSITLTAVSGTSDEELAEARAIVDSMRTDAHDTALGFRIIFTLVTDDWDSG
jgi:hypothetical protein